MRIVSGSGFAILLAGAAMAQPLSPPGFTQAQAARGEQAYMSNCASCHGDRLDNGGGDGAPNLVGAAFVQGWGAKPLSELYDYTSANMPASSPASLPPQTYADIIAFLLSKNGVAAGSTELPPDEAKLKTLSGPH
jgi:mono/diheme cytochrome c family protein